MTPQPLRLRCPLDTEVGTAGAGVAFSVLVHVLDETKRGGRKARTGRRCVC